MLDIEYISLLAAQLRPSLYQSDDHLTLINLAARVALDVQIFCCRTTTPHVSMGSVNHSMTGFAYPTSFEVGRYFNFLLR